MQICPKCRTRFENRVERCSHDGRRLVADLTGVTVAGRYLLRELLGVGGMDSSVWLAMQQPVQRPVAVKLLPPTDGESADRFARGARIASNLAHPHITVVHDYGRTEEGQLFLVMELLEGRILHDVMKTGALPVEQALHITDQVLKALDHAHKKNVVHRDIKPGNLFLCARNDDPDFVKVLDFGIARFIDASDAFFDEPHQEITTTRQICGTPQYMAPEQIAMGTVDARTDLYALGIVLYRMITGELPFQSKDHRELFRAHLTQTPPPFASVRPGLHLPELEALVMRALAKSPDDRFASAAEMRTALRQLRVRMAGGGDDEFTPISSVASTPSAVSAASSHPGTLPLTVVPPRRDLTVPLVVVVLILLGLGAFLWLNREPAGGPAATPPLRGEAPVSVAAADAPASGAPDSATPEAPVSAAPDSAAPASAALDSAAPASAAPDSAAPASVAPASVAPASVAPASEALRSVHITSTPPGARIRWAGRDLGATPRTIDLPVGTHQLVLTQGASQAALAVDVPKAGKIPSLHAVLRRADAPPRGPRAPESAPAAPPSVAAPSVAAPPSTLRMKLLDEGEAREFGAGGRPPVEPTEKPKVDLLEE